MLRSETGRKRKWGRSRYAALGGGAGRVKAPWVTRCEPLAARQRDGSSHQLLMLSLPSSCLHGFHCQLCSAPYFAAFPPPSPPCFTEVKGKQGWMQRLCCKGRMGHVSCGLCPVLQLPWDSAPMFFCSSSPHHGVPSFGSCKPPDLCGPEGSDTRMRQCVN